MQYHTVNNDIEEVIIFIWDTCIITSEYGFVGLYLKDRYLISEMNTDMQQ